MENPFPRAFHLLEAEIIADRVRARFPLDLWRTIHNHSVVNYLSTAFAALSDPTRRKIVDRLSRGPACVSDLVRPFRISQQGISKHVAYLERARLIVKVRQGRQHLCSLRSDPIREIARWADGYRRFWEARLDKFDEALKLKQKAAHKQSEKEI